MSYHHHRRIQRFSLGVGILFFLFIGGWLVYRSFNTPGVALLSEDVAKEGLELARNLSEVTGTELHLQDFHRVEVKDGRPVWEIKAKDAKYYADQGLTHVTDAEVIIFERRGSPISLKAKVAKLFLKSSALEKAELEGNIVVTRGKQVSVHTNLASYYAKSGKIVAPGPVKIKGTGYVIRGIGMEMFLDKEDIKLLSSVESGFMKEDPEKKS